MQKAVGDAKTAAKHEVNAATKKPTKSSDLRILCRCGIDEGSTGPLVDAFAVWHITGTIDKSPIVHLVSRHNQDVHMVETVNRHRDGWV